MCLTRSSCPAVGLLIRLLPEHDTTLCPLPGSVVVTATSRVQDAGLEEKSTAATATANGDDDDQEEDEPENAQGFLFNPQRKQSAQPTQVRQYSIEAPSCLVHLA
jgi:hypothetical protein